jgi:hypothetical protein
LDMILLQKIGMHYLAKGKPVGYQTNPPAIDS